MAVDWYNKMHTSIYSYMADGAVKIHAPKTYIPNEINKENEDAFCKDWKKALEHRIVTLEDPIRPDHYGGADNPYEVFSVLEAWELDKYFYLGNVIKYVARAGKKDPLKRKEDLQKALVYLQKRIDSL